MQPYPALLDQAKWLKTNKRDNMFYYDSGGGDADKPSVILIHGLGDEADSWRRLIPLLKESCRTLAPDLPGFGRSKAGGIITIDRHIKAIVSLLELIGPAALAGNSLGGMIAQAVAAEKPSLVTALVLIDGGAPLAQKSGNNTADGALSLLGKALPFYGPYWYRKFRENHTAAYHSLFGYYHNLESLPEDDRAFLRKRVIERVESVEQEKAYFATLRSMIWRSMTKTAFLARALADYKGVVSLVWGENDAILPPKTAEIIRSIRKDAPFVLIPNAGHLPQQENPAAVADAIVAAIAGGGRHSGCAGG
ncbi:MAG: alpha/beta hydrolase [Treponema sp.]|nr:alpha/beta hydrolase [Treponema sp.]